MDNNNECFALWLTAHVVRANEDSWNWWSLWWAKRYFFVKCAL